MINTVDAPRRTVVRRVPRRLLRLVVTVHAAAVFAQPVLAGQFLNGNFDMVVAHGAVAGVISLLGFGQVLLAVGLRWPGRGPLWPLWVSLLVLVAEAMQLGAGYSRVLSVHVPLGVAIASGMLLMLVAVWRGTFAGGAGGRP